MLIAPDMTDRVEYPNGYGKPASSRVSVVIGASLKPWRYAYKAVQSLHLNGFPVIAIGPREGNIGDVPVRKDTPLDIPVDTVTLYLGAERQTAYYDYLIRLKPLRVIFNPGAENDELATILSMQGIEVIEACTLVMLASRQY